MYSIYIGYTYMNFQRFNIILRKRITIFLYLQSLRVFLLFKQEMPRKMDIQEE